MQISLQPCTLEKNACLPGLRSSLHPKHGGTRHDSFTIIIFDRSSSRAPV
jgi:hypothetical protein